VVSTTLSLLAGNMPTTSPSLVTRQLSSILGTAIIRREWLSQNSVLTIAPLTGQFVTALRPFIAGHAFITRGDLQSGIEEKVDCLERAKAIRHP
jgi:hypothetical protein